MFETQETIQVNFEICGCNCGALTVQHEEWPDIVCMTESTMKELFPLLSVPKIKPQYACNHCVNHYGIDLCGCGSGEPVGKCDGEFDECKNKQASQSIGESQMSSVEAMIKRGSFI